MPLVNALPGPGFVIDGVDYFSQPRFIGGSWVRFVHGYPEKMGGWTPVSGSSVSGIGRALKTFNDIQGNQYLGVATNIGVYLLQGQSTTYDITPIRQTVNLTNPITTIGGSTSVQITQNAHNCLVGDTFVVNSQGSSVGGVTLSGPYTVATVIDANNFTITIPSPAGSSAGPGGGTVNVSNIINTGTQSDSTNYGYSAGGYGQSGYGNARSSGLVTPLRQWSLDNWGEDLLLCASGQQPAVWISSTGPTVRGSVIANAPAKVQFMLVSYPDRHMIALGCTDTGGNFNPLQVRWSDTEDYTTWTATATNAAGGQVVNGSNRIVGAVKTRNQICVFTDSNMNIMRYVGTPYIFSIAVAADNCGLIAPHAAVDSNGTVYWMSQGCFYMYNGAVQRIPCQVEYGLFRPDRSTIAVDYNNQNKIYAGTNGRFGEIIWLYPSVRGNGECDSYVIYNYVQNIWYTGSLTRTAWIDQSNFNAPIAMGTDSVLYNHEVGYSAAGAPINAYLKSGLFDMADGTTVVFTDRFVLHLAQGATPLSLTPSFAYFPNDNSSGANLSTKGPFPVTQGSFISGRGRGRHLTWRMDSNTVEFWRLNSLTFNQVPDGMR